MKLKTVVVGGEHLTPQQEKYRKIFMYLVSGGLTTVVSLSFFKIFNLVVPDIAVQAFGQSISLKLAINKTACWVISVLVAYFLNRVTVFRSKGKILSELMKFAGAMVLSFLIFEEGLFLLSVFICTKVSGQPSDTAVYTLLNIPITYADIMNVINMVFVIIANYIMSKMMVFKKEDMVDYSKQDEPVENESEEAPVKEEEEGAQNA